MYTVQQAYELKGRTHDDIGTLDRPSKRLRLEADVSGMQNYATK